MATKRTSKKSHLHLFFIPAIILALAAAGGWIVSGGLDWYEAIQKPALTPPNVVFRWAWIAFYFLVGYSALVVWSRFKRDTRFKVINVLFGVSAFFFLLYVFLFFRMHHLPSATLVAVLLEISVILLAVLIWPQSKRAAAALFPVSAWIVLGAYLCYMTWVINDFSALAA